MVNVPIRSIGELGVIPDYGAHDLPMKAWADAINLRFDQGYVSRYSVFKTVESGFDFGTDRVVGGLEAGGLTGNGYLVYVKEDGSMVQRYSGASTNVEPTGGGVSLGTSTLQPTVCKLGGITYVNRSVDVPCYRESPGDGNFTQLTDSGWDADDRCAALRSYKDFLIALNVTKDATEYPGMMKWSDAAQAGAPPANWDTTSDSSLAGENVLSECADSLVDGLTLGSGFIIYGETQTFRVDYVGQPFIFNTQMLFNDQGIMNVNCVVEAENRHYVFGKSDIYVHDGISKVSIADGKTLKTIMAELDVSKKDRCFVYHDRRHREVAFCYPSANSDCAWSLSEVNGCNRAWVYNYRSQTWYPVDLPGLVGWCEASVPDTVTWDDLRNWRREKNPWSAFEGDKPICTTLISDGNSSASYNGRFLFLDDLVGGILGNPADEDILWDAWGEWQAKDMDELGVELYGRKQVNHVDLQFAALDTDNTLKFSLGHSRGANTPITWGRVMEIDPWQDTRYDCRVNDRYIAMRIEYPAGSDASFGGFDMDVIQIAKR